MKYLIDNAIVFNTDDGTLFQTETLELVTLPVTAVRLLEEFTLSGGRELTREYLLDTVWENHGLQATDGNLRQYISILRRHLATLGRPEFIVTIPKLGFKVNPEVGVSTEIHALELKSKAIQIVDDSEEPVTLQVISQRGNNILLYVLGTCLCLIVILVFWYAKNRPGNPPNHFISSDGCDITFVKDIPEETRMENVPLINGILKNKGLVCTKNNFIIFDKEISTSSGNNSRFMLSFCSQGKNNEALSCENFYQYQVVDK